MMVQGVVGGGGMFFRQGGGDVQKNHVSLSFFQSPKQLLQNLGLDKPKGLPLHTIYYY